MNKIAPQDMRQHLMLNQSRLSTAEEVAQEIEDYWDATEEFSRDDKNQAGFIAPVGKGPVKGEKPNGVPYNYHLHVDNERECDSNANLVSIYARRFPPGRWSFFGPGSEKKWYSSHGSRPQREWDRIAEQMMLTFAENKHPVFRSTSPLSRGVLKSKGGEQLSIQFCADKGKIETVFRTIVSVNQLSVYGAVSDLCE